MKKLGVVLHRTNEGNLIARASRNSIDTVNRIVLTRGGVRIGRIYDVFGPVKRPYVSIRTFEVKGESTSGTRPKLDGEWVYVS
jgi:RNA-binding protein